MAKNLPKTVLLHESVQAGIAVKANSSDIPTALSSLTDDSTHRLTTDTEKSTWNAKSNFSGSYDDLTNKPTIPTISDIAYDATSWNGNTDAPTKNAIRDKIETMGGGVSLSDVYPIGSIYIETTGTNPNTTFGFGTWTAFATGRTLVGYSSGDGDFGTVEGTGGEKTHTLTEAEMPSHTHNIGNQLRSATTGSQTTNIALSTDTSSTQGTYPSASTGSGSAHNNLQPYIVVFFWKRTA